jgi:hypothetical protein
MHRCCIVTLADLVPSIFFPSAAHVPSMSAADYENPAVVAGLNPSATYGHFYGKCSADAWLSRSIVSA